MHGHPSLPQAQGRKRASDEFSDWAGVRSFCTMPEQAPAPKLPHRQGLRVWASRLVGWGTKAAIALVQYHCCKQEAWLHLRTLGHIWPSRGVATLLFAFHHCHHPKHAPRNPRMFQWQVEDTSTVLVRAMVERGAAADAIKASLGYEEGLEAGGPSGLRNQH